ncbi:hypothetical protein D3C80_1361410 [compost metagenome]
MSYRCSAFFQRLNGLLRKIPDMTNCNQSDIFTIRYFSTCTNWNRFHRCFPFGHHTVTTRIPDGKRSVIFRLSSKHQIAQFRLVHRSRNNHIRHTAHISNIVSTMMRRTVSTDQATAIQTENYGQILQSHIMQNLIVGTLHE